VPSSRPIAPLSGSVVSTRTPTSRSWTTPRPLSTCITA
jgi:hypothetical protein